MSLWMNAGTIAVTLNNKKVTGTGTAFANSAIPARPGQPIVISNVIYEIERVESDTVLWLATNYLGASATGVKYSIMTTMEGSFNDLSRRAAQVMGAYQGYMDVYEALFTGTGNVTVTLPDGSIVTLPAWGNLQPKDATLSALAGLVGAAGTFAVFTGTDTAALKQISDMYQKSTILGNVSQAAGVPTGAIIERGSNANGKYTRFADGRMICTGSKVVLMSSLVDNTIGAHGWSFLSGTVGVTFPAVFSGQVHVSGGGGVRTDGFSIGGLLSVEQATPSGVQLTVWAQSPYDRVIQYTATGYWF